VNEQSAQQDKPIRRIKFVPMDFETLPGGKVLLNSQVTGNVIGHVALYT
jgi:hypothetical protein